eukprot:CAMPEP_0178787172 /NCGR_PEP_ID=MMETSP0745-20121128/5713_1 /TAXON_ID=913974 /ORGANISM="Nitzschia punctata, Strain CCMP561" /LENGTH=514 /DNA_ID=CAMNT_0020445005 /DNA_START=41 /DNA_END=1585 /DNA_ORIENTATION=+
MKVLLLPLVFTPSEDYPSMNSDHNSEKHPRSIRDILESGAAATGAPGNAEDDGNLGPSSLQLRKPSLPLGHDLTSSSFLNDPASHQRCLWSDDYVAKPGHVSSHHLGGETSMKAPEMAITTKMASKHPSSAETDALAKGSPSPSPKRRRASSAEFHLSFPQRLMRLLSNEAVKDIARWLPHGKGFSIHDKKRFEDEVLPAYFGQKSKFSSFTRKLNRWNFTRVTRGPETGSYYHPLFQRGNEQLCSEMTCSAPATGQHSEPMNPVALGIATPAMIQHGFIEHHRPNNASDEKIPAEPDIAVAFPGIDPNLLQPTPIHPSLARNLQQSSQPNQVNNAFPCAPDGAIPSSSEPHLLSLQQRLRELRQQGLLRQVHPPSVNDNMGQPATENEASFSTFQESKSFYLTMFGPDTTQDFRSVTFNQGQQQLQQHESQSNVCWANTCNSNDLNPDHHRVASVSTSNSSSNNVLETLGSGSSGYGGGHGDESFSDNLSGGYLLQQDQRRQQPHGDYEGKQG